MKTCKACGQEKPDSEFYDHPTAADRKLSICKPCKRQLTHDNRVKDLDKSKARERELYKLRKEKKWQTDPL